MTIQFQCPHCGVSTQTGDQFAGQSGPCRQCGQTITVPIPAGQAAPLARGGSSSTGSVLTIVAVVGLLGLVVCGGLLTALLLPAVQAAREAARRAQCANNMKQIALALHNYHDSYGSMPPAYTVDDQGRRLHSWRTLILPYLEQSALYSQIALDEPWDSPRNQAFHHVAIKTFECPSVPSTGPNCHYVVLVGPNTMFPGASAVKFADVTDGTSNTIMVVETKGTGKTWMAPDDLDITKVNFTSNGGPNEPGSFHPGGFQVSLADGSVRFISASVNPTVLQQMATRNGGEVVPPSF